LLDGEILVGQGHPLPRSRTDKGPGPKSRNNQLLWAAYEQIHEEVQIRIRRLGHEHIAVVVGTSTSGIAETEEALQIRNTTGYFPDSYRFEDQEPGSPALFLAKTLGLTNAAMTVSTACSSSAKAFVTAAHLIQTGFCKAAIVGGVDTLCSLTTNGFKALDSLSSTICAPFSENRDGITLGEGAALFLLGTDPWEIELAGMGESSDAYHISSPEPTGRGAGAAMTRALHSAGLEARQIDYINLHGTGTLQNDAMEAVAVSRLFGRQVSCSSTKALTGHTLGAAGALELGLCWLVLSQFNGARCLPPHVFDGARDRDLPPLALTAPGSHYGQGVRHALSNSFAFGGNNCSLILTGHGEGGFECA